MLNFMFFGVDLWQRRAGCVAVELEQEMELCASEGGVGWDSRTVPTSSAAGVQVDPGQFSA